MLEGLRDFLLTLEYLVKLQLKVLSGENRGFQTK